MGILGRLVIVVFLFHFQLCLYAEERGKNEAIEAWNIYREGNYTRAIEVSEKILASSPDSLWKAMAHNVIAKSEFRLGRSIYSVFSKEKEAALILESLDVKKYKHEDVFRKIFADACVLAWKKNLWMDCEHFGQKYILISKEYMEQDYATYLNVLYATVEAMQALNKHDDVLKFMSLLTDISSNKMSDEESRLCTRILLKIPSSMVSLGRIDEAIGASNVMCTSVLASFGKDDILTLESQYTLAECLYRYGQKKEALDLFLLVAKTQIPIDLERRYTAAAYCGDILSSLGRAEEGVALFDNLMKSYNIKTLSRNVYSNLLFILHALQKESGDLDRARKTYENYLSVVSFSPEDLHVKCANAIKNGELQQARLNLDQLRSHYEALNDSISLSFSDYLSLEFGYCIAAHTVPATKDLDLFINSRKRNLGKANEKYAESVMSVASLSYQMKNYERVSSCVIEYIKVMSNIITTRFLVMNKEERNKYWKNVKGSLCETIPMLSYLCNNDSLSNAGYQAALLSKGLLLRTEISLEDINIENDESNIVKKLENFKSDFNKMIEEMAVSDNVDEEKVMKLLLNFKSFENYSPSFERLYRKLNVKVKDVAESLKDEDLAVEFVWTGPSKGCLLAYVLRRDWKYPKAIGILTEQTLHKFSKEDYFRENKFSKIIWKQISDNAGEGVKNIYFAPDGPLYKIPIEYLPDFEYPNTNISKRWNIYRLSSTGELALKYRRDKRINAAMFGGMDFNELSGENSSVDSASTRKVGIDELFLSESGLRGGVNNLPGTLVEINNISEVLANSKVDYAEYVGKEANEDKFKSISGIPVSLVHIATHGFYWTQTDSRKLRKISFLENVNESETEDYALTRSGLLFSGANKVLTGQKIPIGKEDGVLTALEISSLDFSTVDMLVMSACETGLGDITSDGVFGLQRGFKKAGVNTMLMSLWKVDDKATQMLMTKFYEYFLSGKSKFESLRHAQKYVREYEVETELINDESNITASQRRKSLRQGEIQETTTDKVKIRPFAAPKYWAAFVLLDALN